MANFDDYDEYTEYNRFINLDGIENKIVNKLLNDKSKYAENFWKLLKYNDISPLSKPNLTLEEKKELVCDDNMNPTNKRVFVVPFIDDAWQEQCSSVYIFVDNITFQNAMLATVNIAIETVVHSKISVISGDSDKDLNPNANPNDSDVEGNIVVAFKNRATMLLKCILATLNGLYLDGAGKLIVDKNKGSKCELSLWNTRSFYGHSLKMSMDLASTSDRSEEGY